MKYTDPFLEQQNRLAGAPNAQEGISVSMPSLQVEDSRARQIASSGDAFMAQLIAKKAQQAAQSKQTQDSGYDPTGKTPEQIMAETGQQSTLDQIRKDQAIAPQAIQEQLAQPTPQIEKPLPQVMAETGRQSELDQMMQQPIPPQELQPRVEQSKPVVARPQQAAPVEDVKPAQANPALVDSDVTITARANQPYLGGRINAGTDFAGQAGKPVFVPEGEWEVTAARNDVKSRRPEDFSEAQNFGWGNSVEAVNKQTGEKIRLSHMQYGSVPDLKPGQVLKGGEQIGAIGNTGNTHGKSGNHLDAEYYDSNGRRQDIASSKLAASLFKGQPAPQPEVTQPPETVLPATQSAQMTQVEPQPSLQPLSQNDLLKLFSSGR